METTRIGRLVIRTATMTPDETLRRKATSAMIELVIMHSPAQAALRDEGRRHDALFEAYMTAIEDGRESEHLSDQLAASSERLARLVDLVADQTDRGAA
jgi:hypothetical protein